MPVWSASFVASRAWRARVSFLPSAASTARRSSRAPSHAVRAWRHVVGTTPFHVRRRRCATGAAPAAASSPSTLELPADGVWEGLHDWRAAPLNRRWVWGKRDAVLPEADPKDLGSENADRMPPGPWVSLAIDHPNSDSDPAASLPPLPPTLAECADLILRTPDPAVKAALSHRAYARFVDPESPPMPVGVAAPPDRPARPARPVLVPPKEVPSPKTCELGMSAAMMHNVAHIELNAIDLAWDTVARFSSLRGGEDGKEENSGILPDEFFRDFARVADDESRHLGWCLQRLDEMGVAYGDIPAHDVLWEGAEETAGSLPARLAVVPCMQEARGLDAGPRLVSKLQGRGDNRSAGVIARISEEELAHVAVGVVWFRRLCEALGADPGDSFRSHIAAHAPESLRGPFNHQSRVAAGLEPGWYSVGPEHRMGHEFEGDERRGELPRKLVERLRAVLALEGVTELPPAR